MPELDAAIRLHKVFVALPDPRGRRGRRHRLDEMLVILVVALLCGATNCEDVAWLGRHHIDWFRTFLQLKHGVASHDRFLALLALLDPKELERCVRDWVLSLREPGVLQGDRAQYAFDGKTLRASGNATEGLRPLHLVSADFVGQGVVLGTEAVDRKSNEITAIPRLLAALDVRGATVSVDAMGCQQSIAQAVLDGGGDYLLQIKGNQPRLEEAAEQAMAQALRPGGVGKIAAGLELERCRDVNKGHGRLEQRTCVVLRGVEVLEPFCRWPGAKTLVMVAREREVLRRGQPSRELAYYLSSDATLTAARGQRLVRNHWQVENNLHWVLDVQFNEDHCTIRDRRAAHNLAAVRRQVATLLQASVGPRMSGRRLRMSCQSDPRMTLQVLAGAVIEREAQSRAVGPKARAKAAKAARSAAQPKGPRKPKA